jgi:hypothetical protein
MPVGHIRIRNLPQDKQLKIAGHMSHARAGMRTRIEGEFLCVLAVYGSGAKSRRQMAFAVSRKPEVCCLFSSSASLYFLVSLLFSVFFFISLFTFLCQFPYISSGSLTLSTFSCIHILALYMFAGFQGFGHLPLYRAERWCNRQG